MRLQGIAHLQGTAHLSEEIELQRVMIWFLVNSRARFWFKSPYYSCVGDVKRYSVGKIRVVVSVVDCVECVWRVNPGAWGSFLYLRQAHLSESDPVGWKPAIGSVAKVRCSAAQNVQRYRKIHQQLEAFQSRVCKKHNNSNAKFAKSTTFENKALLVPMMYVPWKLCDETFAWWNKDNPFAWPDPKTLWSATTWTRTVYTMYVFVYVYRYIHIYRNKYMYTHTWIHIYTCTPIYSYVYKHKCVYEHIYIGIYMHMCMYTCLNIYDENVANLRDSLTEWLFVRNSWSYAHSESHANTRAYKYYKYIHAPILVWFSGMSTCNSLIVQRSRMRSCSSQKTRPSHPVVLRMPVKILCWRVQDIKTITTKIEPRVQKWHVARSRKRPCM